MLIIGVVIADRTQRKMSLLTKIALGIGAVVLMLGSILVTIAALFPPNEWKGGELPSEIKKES